MKQIKYIGYGELTWDKNYDSSLNLIKENGGGTTWNILSNLASFDSRHNVVAIGVVGNDQYGDKAIDVLKLRGVDTRYIKKINKFTNVVYSIIPEKVNGDNDIKYSMISPLNSKDTYRLSEDLSTSFPKEFNQYDNIIILENFRYQNLEFIFQCKSKKVAMDIGRKRVFENYKKEYLFNFLKNIDVCQISMDVLQDLYAKLQIENINELLSIMNPDLLVITNGKKITNFIYKQNDKYILEKKQPNCVTDIIDTTGAGDCFFSVIISNYARYWQHDKKVDKKFIDKVFPLANQLSGEEIKQIGGRCELVTIKKWLEKIKTNERNNEER